DWKSPEFPKGYWPAAAEPLRQVLDDAVWNTSLEGFNSDLNELVDLVADTKVDLTAEIPHTQGHTYLREVLLVADHNAYHIAQIIATRRMLGDWK
ncbi:MAG TPA: DinB family protein, partial [Blastocatellia bacterium]|nr:DinB family protein [Blastocatellia bacterium]